MKDLNWFWIIIALTGPTAVGLLVAIPIWRTGQAILGNLAGTAVIFGTAVGLILRERIELDRLAQACLDRGVLCWPTPSAFARFAIFAFIALVEVMVLFTLSLRFEEHYRRRDTAPEWR